MSAPLFLEVDRDRRLAGKRLDNLATSCPPQEVEEQLPFVASWGRLVALLGIAEDLARVDHTSLADLAHDHDRVAIAVRENWRASLARLDEAVVYVLMPECRALPEAARALVLDDGGQHPVPQHAGESLAHAWEQG